MKSCKTTEHNLLAYRNYDIEYDDNINIKLLCVWSKKTPNRVQVTYVFEDKRDESDENKFVQTYTFKHDQDLYLDTLKDYMDKHIAFNASSIDSKVKEYLERVK